MDWGLSLASGMRISPWFGCPWWGGRCCFYMAVSCARGVLHPLGKGTFPFLVYALVLALLALFIRQRLCINFYVSRANFLTTLRSHLNVTCSYYFWSNLVNVNGESLHTLDN